MVPLVSALANDIEWVKVFFEAAGRPHQKNVPIVQKGEREWGIFESRYPQEGGGGEEGGGCDRLGVCRGRRGRRKMCRVAIRGIGQKLPVGIFWNVVDWTVLTSSLPSYGCAKAC
jgi:hypothetical protein